jgi:hypothetical protein
MKNSSIISSFSFSFLQTKATKKFEKNSLYSLDTAVKWEVQVFVFEILSEPNQIAMLQNDENLKIKLIQMMFRLLIFSFEYGRKIHGRV